MDNTPTPAPQSPAFLDRSLNIHRNIKVPHVLAAFAVFIIFVTAGLSAESNFGTAGPGPVFVVSGQVSGSAVSDEGAGPGEGRFSFTTVKVKRVSTLRVLWSNITGQQMIRLDQTALTAVGQMDDAKHDAALAAHNYLDSQHNLMLPNSGTSTEPTLIFATGVVGGPSAGLMMALAFVDAMSPGDLTAGLNVAGTGTVDVSGAVGPISGMEYKLPAALDAGNDVFFVPDMNANDFGDETFEPMQLVVVTNLQTAIDWLCNNGATDAVCPAPEAA